MLVTHPDAGKGRVDDSLATSYGKAWGEVPEKLVVSGVDELLRSD